MLCGRLIFFFFGPFFFYRMCRGRIRRMPGGLASADARVGR